MVVSKLAAKLSNNARSPMITLSLSAQSAIYIEGLFEAKEVLEASRVEIRFERSAIGKDEFWLSCLWFTACDQ